MMTSKDSGRWPVGSLVSEKGADPSPMALRMVVGYRADGRCMTAYVTPPPWLTHEQQSRIYDDAVTALMLHLPELIGPASEVA